MTKQEFDKLVTLHQEGYKIMWKPLGVWIYPEKDSFVSFEVDWPAEGIEFDELEIENIEIFEVKKIENWKEL